MGSKRISRIIRKPIQARNSRVRHYALRWSRRRLLAITARGFRSTKRQHGLVVPLYALPIKELAFRLKPIRARRRQTKTRSFLSRLMLTVSYTLIISGLVGGGYFIYQAKRPYKIDLPSVRVLSIPTPPLEVIKPSALQASEPVHLHIADIKLDAPVIKVGRLADGSIQTPNVLDYVTGWYQHSPTPGELGPAVIVGHVDSYKGVSVFWRLRELQPGNLIEVTRADGSVAKFRVESLKQFDQANFPTEEVYGNLNYAGLRLITCGGTFDRQTKHYTANTVVFAALLTD